MSGARYISAPWGPFCWDCDGSGDLEMEGTDYVQCVDCAGTGRAGIPWSELFKHGGKNPPEHREIFRRALR